MSVVVTYMKYSFKIPLVQTSGVGVKDGYIVAHRVFLGGEDRAALQKPGTVVEAVASFVPTRVRPDATSDPGEEVFSPYKIISTDHPDSKILPTNIGWWVYLNAAQVRRLIDVREGGSEFLAMVFHDIITVKDLAYPILHQIVISDVSDLERNMHCCHLPHTVSK